ncbi:Retrovirus-related Pol polyprotein from transposon 297 [Araneus ventricosus]|uniref:RNA-directed DNA polymerase n=1 Tax=Araneus ventricosus TaxID=182803 RepID=A0A4Y2NKK4_ARAVE|nr:Retrovirus-related Pol polyprotein from transposon 297 [Araneus ventricosus]
MAENADLLALLAEMKKSMEKGQEEMRKGQDEMRKGQEEMKDKMEKGQEEMKDKMEKGQKEMKDKMEKGQEEMRKGQGEMKNEIQRHVESKVGEIKDHVNSCIEKIEEDVQSVKREIGEVKSEVERKIEEVEDKVQGTIEEVKEKVQVKIGDLEKRISELEDRPINFPANPDLTYSRPMVKSLTFYGQTSWTVFKTQFDVVSSANGWNNRMKASQLVASLRGSEAEVLQGIPSDKLTDLMTIENALEARFGDSHLTQFYRTESKTRRQKPGESLRVLAADVERLMSLACAECPQDVRDSLAAQYFVDAIRDEDTQHATRLMDAKDLKSALAYSMKYEAAKTVSKTSRNVRSIEVEDGTGKEKDEKFDCLLKTLEKLLNSHVAEKKNTPRRNPNVTCWKCNKKVHLQRECQTISPNQEKLMYGRPTGRRLPFLNKAPEEGLKVSALCGGRNGLYLEGSICSIPCLMLVDTGANVTLVRTDLAQKMKENFIYTAPNISLKTATGEKAEIRGKLDAAIECGCRKLQHKIYVADITYPCILGLDFLQKFNFTVDLEKNETGTGGEEIPLFSTKAIPVRVLNLDHKPKTIDKGAVIATCEPVVDIVARPQEFSESLRLPSIVENLEGLNEEQRTAVKELLQEFQNLFSTSDSDVGRCNMTQHRINTDNLPPIKQYPRRLPLAKKEEAERLVKEMVDNGIIEESSGPWASPIVLVKKKDGSTRFCVDYRKSNEITIKDSYPLPRIDDTMDALDGSQWFLTLDLKSGYWQVEIQPEDKDKTAFTTGQGLSQFKVMPFGLCNAPATFERLMETVLSGLTSEACLVCLDDIIIVGRTFQEHLNNIRKVFQRLQKANLKLSPKKCRFFRKEVSYLGHIISADGVKADPEKTKAVVDWPRPETVHDLRSFLGLCTNYRRFVRNFSAIARPLHKLTEDRSNFNWTEECEKSFNSLKQALITSPVLTYPRTDKEFILDTDASNKGIGAVLFQKIGNEECVIAYFSKSLGKPERNYCVTRKELLAIVKSIEHFHH